MLANTMNHLSTAKWVGYQIFLGFRRGLGVQMPTLAVQILQPNFVPIGMSLIVFSQTFGGSVFLTVANVVVNNKLKPGITQLAPEVSADRVIGAGATTFQSVVPEGYLMRILEAYSWAFSAVFYLSAGLAVVYFSFAWGIGWTDVRKKEVKGVSRTTS